MIYSRKNILLLVSALIGVPFSAHAIPLATVNGTEISLETFNQKYEESKKFFHFGAPTKKAVLDDMIKRELAVQEARRMGLEKDPQVIDRINTVLYHSLLEKQLSKQVEKMDVSAEEAKSYYQENPEIRTSHIFVSAPNGASAADEAKAFEKMKQIQDKHLKPGKLSFAEVAQKYSEGSVAAMGGDLDFQTEDKLDPTYYRTAVKLGRPGAVSGIIRSAFGYHIIKLTAIHSWNEVNQGTIKRLVFEKKKKRLFDQYMATLQNKAKVTTKAELLK